jgi:hypothetical protein
MPTMLRNWVGRISRVFNKDSDVKESNENEPLIQFVRFASVAMAVKKQSLLEEELKNADLMSILSGGGNSSVFKKNDIIDYSYPTGISVIDYPLAYEINIVNEKGEKIGKRVCYGIQAGTFNVLTGSTQSFKTTLGIQMSANIAYANNGNVIHYDAENRLVVQRVKNLTKLPESWFSGDAPRYQIRGGAIGFDTLQHDITEIAMNKIKYKNILLKDTGVVDGNNKPIYLMPPTVIFLDSISNVIAKEYNVESKDFMNDMGEIRGNADGMRNAKTLRGVLTDLNPLMKEANIIIITIAHKGTNISAGVTPQPKQFQYGKQDEKISGGKALEYGASALMNFTNFGSESSRYHMDSDGFEGNTILFEPLKVSTNESGNAKSGLGFEIIIDKRKNGVDNLRTLVQLLVAKGRLKGNKANYKVCDENGEVISKNFSWKHIYEDFEKDKETFKAFMIAAKEELEKFISRADDTAGTINPFDINATIIDLDGAVDIKDAA